MKSLAHFLAESANFDAEGTFTVFKGGITDINAATWPVVTRVALITRLELDYREATREVHEMRLRILHEGRRMGAVVRQPIAVNVSEENKPIYVNAIAALNLLVPGPGRITIEAWVNEMALPLLYLTAVELPI